MIGVLFNLIHWCAFKFFNNCPSIQNYLFDIKHKITSLFSSELLVQEKTKNISFKVIKHAFV